MRLGRKRIRRHDRPQRKPPRVVAEITLRPRHLLLPRRDSDHHAVVGHPVGLHEEKLVIRVRPDLGRERLKRRGDERHAIGGIGLRAASRSEHDIGRRLDAGIVMRRSVVFGIADEMGRRELPGGKNRERESRRGEGVDSYE